MSTWKVRGPMLGKCRRWWTLVIWGNTGVVLLGAWIRIASGTMLLGTAFTASMVVPTL